MDSLIFSGNWPNFKWNCSPERVCIYIHHRDSHYYVGILLDEATGRPVVSLYDSYNIVNYLIAEGVRLSPMWTPAGRYSLRAICA